MSLERQLQQKQRTIEKSVDRPKEDVKKLEHRSQAHNCAPMEAEKSCRIAIGNKGGYESSVETNERERILSGGEVRIPENTTVEQVRKK